ncbi:MAG TPA: MBL fold metallo-hydrolase [Dehalococcoidia bacterium]|nr:MBL fold metallo-hydrolase [Dehalococcoidia bacterium]
MEVTEGVHLITGVRGCNCYLITKPELILIDTGMPGQAGKVLDYISDLGYSGRDLKRIVLTHHDVDHIGSAAELQRLTGAEVCMHRADADCVVGRSPRRPFWKAWLSGLAKVWGQFQPPQITRFLDNGETVGPLRVIHTPGHSAGSISLCYGNVLFVGDLLRWAGPLREVPHPAHQDNKLVGASIRKIAELDFLILCPGHGKPIFDAAEELRG